MEFAGNTGIGAYLVAVATVAFVVRTIYKHKKYKKAVEAFRIASRRTQTHFVVLNDVVKFASLSHGEAENLLDFLVSRGYLIYETRGEEKVYRRPMDPRISDFRTN